MQTSNTRKTIDANDDDDMSAHSIQKKADKTRKRYDISVNVAYSKKKCAV